MLEMSQLFKSYGKDILYIVVIIFILAFAIDTSTRNRQLQGAKDRVDREVSELKLTSRELSRKLIEVKDEAERAKRDVASLTKQLDEVSINNNRAIKQNIEIGTGLDIITTNAIRLRNSIQELAGSYK